MMQHDLAPAEDAREQLRRWDGGGVIWSIEMGGLGPGYEQSIQILAIEIVRDEIDKPLPRPPPHDWADATVGRVDVRQPDGSYTCGGFSGAQVGVARALAWKWLTVGPAAVCAEFPDRKIQVSRFWPRAGVPT